MALGEAPGIGKGGYLGFRRQKQKDDKFKYSLFYTASSRIPKTTKQDSISKTNKQNYKCY